jgi:hypothetical protein
MFSSFLQSPNFEKVLQKKRYKEGLATLAFSRKIYIVNYALQRDPERSSMRSGIDTGSMSEIVPPRKKYRVLASSKVASDLIRQDNIPVCGEPYTPSLQSCERTHTRTTCGSG